MVFKRWYLTGLFGLFVSTVHAAVDDFGKSERRGTLYLHGGISGVFDGEKNPLLGIDYQGSAWKAGLTPWILASWATDGAVFVGGGVARSWSLADGWEGAVGFGPGYYERHEGADLGSHLEFYSYGELTRKIGVRQWIFLRLAHISNGSISDRNPGTELLTMGCRFDLL
jgi:Lipid A 3-O-deacylase (PagL).